MNKNKKPTFYEKLTSQKHIDINGNTNYSTHPNSQGEIVVRRPSKTDQRILLLINEETRRITILNLETMKEENTFINADNCCAEEFHHRIDLISR